jgi:capsule polysaccharide export protein KpsE/RkpR
VKYSGDNGEPVTTSTLEPESSLELKSSSDRPKFKLMEAVWLLWAKRRFLVWLTVAGLALSTAYAFWLPKKYTSTTQLMPPGYGGPGLAAALPALDSGSGAGGGGGSSITSLASQLLGLNTSNDLYVGVLNSRSVEDSIIHRLGLMNVYRTRFPSDARKILSGQTDIQSDQDTGIITISVTDKDPKRAASIAQEYVTELNNVLVRVNTSSAHRERVFLEQRLTAVKTKLEKSSQDFSQFASKNSAIDIPAQAKAMVAAAADLQGRLIEAQAELRGLQQIYTNNNARVRQLQGSVAELQSQIDKFGGKNINVATGSTLSNNELFPSVRQLPLLGVKYLDLYRESQIDEGVYELLTKEYEIAKLEEARDLPTAEVLDPADVPQKKSSPHRLYIMLEGMFLSFIMATSWIVGKEAWERVDPRQPWKVFGKEVYGTCMGHPAAVRLGRGVDRAVGLVRRNHHSNGNGA